MGCNLSLQSCFFVRSSSVDISKSIPFQQTSTVDTYFYYCFFFCLVLLYGVTGRTKFYFGWHNYVMALDGAKKVDLERQEQNMQWLGVAERCWMSSV